MKLQSFPVYNMSCHITQHCTDHRMGFFPKYHTLNHCKESNVLYRYKINSCLFSFHTDCPHIPHIKREPIAVTLPREAYCLSALLSLSLPPILCMVICVQLLCLCISPSLSLSPSLLLPNCSSHWNLHNQTQLSSQTAVNHITWSRGIAN